MVATQSITAYRGCCDSNLRKEPINRLHAISNLTLFELERGNRSLEYWLVESLFLLVPR